MRTFANINGIEIIYSDIFREDDTDHVEIKCINFSNKTYKTETATCILPEFDWKETNNFDEETIEYLTNVLKHCQKEIFDDAKNHAGPVYKEYSSNDNLEQDRSFLSDEER